MPSAEDAQAKGSDLTPSSSSVTTAPNNDISPEEDNDNDIELTDEQSKRLRYWFAEERGVLKDLKCVVCYEVFEQNATLIRQQQLSPRVCQKMYKLFYSELVAMEDISNTRPIFDFTRECLPFCKPCQNVLISGVKICEKMRILTEDLEEKMKELRRKVFETKAKSDGFRWPDHRTALMRVQAKKRCDKDPYSSEVELSQHVVENVLDQTSCGAKLQVVMNGVDHVKVPATRSPIKSTSIPTSKPSTANGNNNSNPSGDPDPKQNLSSQITTTASKTAASSAPVVSSKIPSPIKITRPEPEQATTTSAPNFGVAAYLATSSPAERLAIMASATAAERKAIMAAANAPEQRKILMAGAIVKHNGPEPIRPQESTASRPTTMPGWSIVKQFQPQNETVNNSISISMRNLESGLGQRHRRPPARYLDQEDSEEDKPFHLLPAPRPSPGLTMKSNQANPPVKNLQKGTSDRKYVIIPIPTATARAPLTGEKEKNTKCTICNKVFATNAGLNGHVWIHKKAYCPSCRQFFASTDEMDSHIATTHGNNTVNCRICNRSFYYPEKFPHIATHSVFATFGCAYCSQRFKYCNQVREHMKGHEFQLGINAPSSSSSVSTTVFLNSSQNNNFLAEDVEEGEPMPVEMSGSNELEQKSFAEGDEADEEGMNMYTEIISSEEEEDEEEEEELEMEEDDNNDEEEQEVSFDNYPHLTFNEEPVAGTSRQAMASAQVQGEGEDEFTRRAMEFGKQNYRSINTNSQTGNARRARVIMLRQLPDGTTEYICDICGHVADTRIKIVSHKRNHLSKVFECRVCHRRFKRRDNLVVHMKKAHTNAEREEANVPVGVGHQCQICSRVFANPRALAVHCRRAHVDESQMGSRNPSRRQRGYFPCNQCDRVFSFSSNRSRHVGTCHPGDHNTNTQYLP